MPEPRFPNALRGASREARRLCQVHVAPELIAAWFQARGRSYPAVAGLPDDADLVNVAYDFYTHAIVWTFEHPSFAAVEPGRAIPVVAAETFLVPVRDGSPGDSECDP